MIPGEIFVGSMDQSDAESDAAHDGANGNDAGPQAPLTRRELRERERASAAASQHSAPQHSVPQNLVEQCSAEGTATLPAMPGTEHAGRRARELDTPLPTRRSLRSRANVVQSEPTMDVALDAPAVAAAPDSANLPSPHSAPRQRRRAAPPTARPRTVRASGRSASAPGGVVRHRSIVRRLGRNTFSVVAMTFVAAMALATSIPANALLTPIDVAAQAEPAASQAPDVEIAASPQALTGDDREIAPVERDQVTARSFEQVIGLENMRTAATFTNDPSGTIQWPFPVGVPISDFYGWRSSPSGFHHGVDFTPGSGTPIQVIADGVVRYVDNNSSDTLGVHVIVDHQIDGQLVSSVYAHMQPGSVRVSEGQHVKVTDELGQVGNTGFSTGAHLHFEIRLNGTEYTDPFAWMQEHAN